MTQWFFAAWLTTCVFGLLFVMGAVGWAIANKKLDDGLPEAAMIVLLVGIVWPFLPIVGLGWIVAKMCEEDVAA